MGKKDKEEALIRIAIIDAEKCARRSVRARRAVALA